MSVLVLVGLLLCAHGADVHGVSDAAAWERAWAEVRGALAEPAVAEARFTWAWDSGWVLTVQLGTERVQIRGLVPGQTHERRVEQLYVGLAQLSRPSATAAATHLRAMLARPTTRVEEVPVADDAPPPEPVSDGLRPVIRVTMLDPRPPPEPPPLPPNHPVIGVSVVADSRLAPGVCLTVGGRRGPVTLGAQVAWALDGTVEAANGWLPPGAGTRETRLDLGTIGRVALGPHADVGALAGGGFRHLRMGDGQRGGGWVPYGGVQLALHDRLTDALQIRTELGWLADLRPVWVDAGIAGAAVLPWHRFRLGVGVFWGGRG